jgi:signal transduction histidine kinase/ActR/RegA family two-component response regulator
MKTSSPLPLSSSGIVCRGVTGELFHSIDWFHHPLGLPAQWPAALKTTLNILFSSQCPMFIWWGPELIQFYNDAYLPSFGIGKHPQAMGQRGVDCWPEIWPVIQPQIDFVMSEGGSTWHEDQLVPIYRNGKIEDVYWTYGYSPILLEDGRVGGVLVVCTETTKKVNAAVSVEKAKHQIEAERSKLKSLFDQAPIPLAMLEGPNHRFQFTNPLYRKYFLGEMDFTGKSVGEVLPDAQAQGFIDLLDNVYKSGEQYVGNETPFSLTNPDGTTKLFFLNFVYEPIRNEYGLVEGILAAVSDVTEQVLDRKKLEEAVISVETERHRFGQIFSDASTSMALTRGPNHIFEHVNPSYARIFANRQLVGKPLLEALPELKGQPFPELFDRVFNTGVPYIEREAKAYLQRGVDGPLEENYFDQTYTRLVSSDGKPYGVFIHAFEVTERVFARRQIQESEAQLKLATETVQRAKEAAENANAAKSNFLANMSHEIRTPLGAILGFVDLIKDENLPRRTLEDYLAVIDRNSHQLLRIIDDILDLSKVEAGMMLIEKIDFSLAEMLSDFSALMGFRARDKGIVFDLKAGSELPEIVSSDSTRLRQILTNIVGNAIKFTEQGRVELKVSFAADMLEFEVHDTGRGISKSQEQGLFQPFSQGDASITRKFGGTGLGLVLTKRLAEALGGSFLLKESAVGQGSTFVARVKVHVPANTKMMSSLGYVSAHYQGSSNIGKLHGLKILLVEDSPDNQALISILLTKSGAIVEIASDGFAGAEAALRGNFDVVLMDVQMPVMDGITAVKMLRTRNYTKPVIALTAHAMKEERERCLQAGFTHFLSKPVQREALFSALTHIFESRVREPI